MAVMNYINEMIEAAFIESNMMDIVTDIKTPTCVGDCAINYPFFINKKNILKDEFVYDVIVTHIRQLPFR